MKVLVGIYVLFFVLFFFFGNITLNKEEAHGVARLICSLIGSFFLSLLIGLPILGLLSLF